MNELTNEKCYFKQVTRRKSANCKVCNNIINVKEQALIVYLDDWAGIPMVISVIHLDCKDKFEYSAYKILPNILKK
jgi:hypothetical protein